MPDKEKHPPQDSSESIHHRKRFWVVTVTLILVLSGFWYFQSNFDLFYLTSDRLPQNDQSANAAINLVPTAVSPTLLTNILPSATPLTTPIITPTTDIQSSPTPTLQTTLPHNTPAEATTGILFLSLLDTDHYHLFAFDPLQTRFYRVTRGNWDDIHPTISPDRKILAFSSNRNGFWDLYLLDLTNNQVTQLTNTPGYDAAPSWSPDGKWLVYESYITPNGPDSGNLEIFIHQVAPNPENNNQPLQLTDQSGADFSPVWSPAGRQIAFVSQRTGNNEIWLADLDQIENRFRNISHNPQSTNQNPQWSPDGKWLAWDARIEGIPWIFAWDSSQPNKPVMQFSTGSLPIWAYAGQTLFYEFQTPNHTYLGSYSFPKTESQIALQPLPSQIKGMSWLEKAPSAQFTDQYELIQNFNNSSLSNIALQPSINIPGGRQRVLPLEGVRAPYSFLQDMVDDSFLAWRSQTNTLSGWDFLSQLEMAYQPLSSPPSVPLAEDWFYTGRAIALESGALNSGWMFAIREEFGADIYWRIFLKTRNQDGSLGQPLQDLPFDLTARYKGNPIAYDQGGAQLKTSPSGYYIDLTELALRYGWERLPVLSSWRTNLLNSRFNEFVARSGLTWYDAMMELYPPEALFTATPLPPPTSTPTPAPSTSAYPTPTLTPSKSLSATPSAATP